MRITFLVPYKGLAGGLRVVTCYGNALLRRGHDVTVIYPARNLPPGRRIREAIRRYLKNERDHLDCFRGRLLQIPEADDRSMPDADAVIATSWQTAEWISTFSSRCGQKFYLIQHDEKVMSHEHEFGRINATMRLPLKKIVISRWLYEVVSGLSGERDIPVIPNGKDFFLSEYEGEGLIRACDIGMLYSEKAFKGTQTGLSAIRKVWESGYNARVVMFGTETPSEAERRIFPFDRAAFFQKPRQEKIRSIYLNTRIWVSPSVSEGFCLPALEAISLGCVVAATDSLGVRDIIDDGKDGFIVPAGDHDALAARILEVLKDADVERRMKIAGLLKSERFSWEASADMLEQVLLGGRSKCAEPENTP